MTFRFGARTILLLGLSLIGSTVTIALLFVPAGRIFDETPLTVGFLIYALGPAGFALLTAAGSQAVGVSRFWRILTIVASYPLGVILTVAILVNLNRLSH